MELIAIFSLATLGLMAAGFADMIQGPPPTAPFRLQGGYYQIPTIKDGGLATTLSTHSQSIVCALKIEEKTDASGVKRVFTKIIALDTGRWLIEAAQITQVLPSGDYTIHVLTEDVKMASGYSSDPTKVQPASANFLTPARLADHCETRQLPATTRAVVNTLISRSGSELAKLATR